MDWITRPSLAKFLALCAHKESLMTSSFYFAIRNRKTYTRLKVLTISMINRRYRLSKLHEIEIANITKAYRKRTCMLALTPYEKYTRLFMGHIHNFAKKKKKNSHTYLFLGKCCYIRRSSLTFNQDFLRFTYIRPVSLYLNLYVNSPRGRWRVSSEFLSRN